MSFLVSSLTSGLEFRARLIVLRDSPVSFAIPAIPVFLCIASVYNNSAESKYKATRMPYPKEIWTKNVKKLLKNS